MYAKTRMSINRRCLRLTTYEHSHPADWQAPRCTGRAVKCGGKILGINANEKVPEARFNLGYFSIRQYENYIYEFPEVFLVNYQRPQSPCQLASSCDRMGLRKGRRQDFYYQRRWKSFGGKILLETFHYKCM